LGGKKGGHGRKEGRVVAVGRVEWKDGRLQGRNEGRKEGRSGQVGKNKGGLEI